MNAWIDKWLEIGQECKTTGERVPRRSLVAWYITYKVRRGK